MTADNRGELDKILTRLEFKARNSSNLTEVYLAHVDIVEEVLAWHEQAVAEREVAIIEKLIKAQKKYIGLAVFTEDRKAEKNEAERTLIWLEDTLDTHSKALRPSEDGSLKEGQDE